jgi:hypothetical protein
MEYPKIKDHAKIAPLCVTQRYVEMYAFPLPMERSRGDEVVLLKIILSNYLPKQENKLIEAFVL